jgi:SSS family solute:Na+ symporter
MKASYIYLAVFAYFLLGTIVALYAKRNMVRGVSDFFIANRTISGFVAALTYSATTYSAFMLVGLAGLTYIGGLTPPLLLLFCPFGFVLNSFNDYSLIII